MRVALHLLPALLLVPALASLLSPARPTPAESAAHGASEMLTLVPDAAGTPGDEIELRPLWRVLLDSTAATRSASGTTLELGRVLCDPSLARASADAAGELLGLATHTDTGTPGAPLWRVLLDGPATERTAEGLVLKLNGCVHRADPDAAPVLEDTYAARLSLVKGLRAFAAAEPSLGTLVIQGEHTPVKGGANLAVSLAGTTQTLELTFDGATEPHWRVERAVALVAPNDAAARRSIVAGLEQLVAADGSFGALTILGREAPAPGGVDLRLEHFGGREEMHASRQGIPLLSVHRPLVAPPVWSAGEIAPLASAALALGLWILLLRRTGARRAVPV